LLDGIWLSGNSSGLGRTKCTVRATGQDKNKQAVYLPGTRDNSHGQTSRLEPSKPGQPVGRAYPLTNGRAARLYLECGDWR